ncbi:isoamyl acetate-hydrolyzing esterase [Microbotryomycetes sp. JL201]|nr:isoamyl acetate-hydrolyzing esterase [Microbotryomycetes sp. JL201]
MRLWLFAIAATILAAVVRHLQRKEMDSPVTMRTIVMFGDSITQGAWVPGGSGAALANLYQRKLDVVNRGLSAEWAIPIAKKWLPATSQVSAPIALMTIWFGANDATLPPSPQSISLQQFKSNLREIIGLIKDPASPNYQQGAECLLITPPPVDAQVRANDLRSRDPPRQPDRDVERTRTFAEAVKEVAQELKIPVVDSWSIVNEAAQKEGSLDRFLRDGLHLSPAGYELRIRKGVQDVISRELPKLHWNALDQTFPHWADIPNHGALGPQYLVPSQSKRE